LFKSVWDITSAINKTQQLAFSFPDTHKAQRQIAAEYKSKSGVGFATCCGAIDGLLIWLTKPAEHDCMEAGFGSKKYFCGHKKKYGINMQAVVEANGKFLDIDLQHPGSCSDFVAFRTSSLKKKMEVPGFLAKGLCLFGDAAYVDTEYMATPVKGKFCSQLEDSYNFYHSQLRIRSECAFGMLVHRWGVLRKPLTSIDLWRITPFVMALCRLHNYCIAEREATIDTVNNGRSTRLVYSVPPPDADDSVRLSDERNVEFVTRTVDGNTLVNAPVALLDAGHHSDDHEYSSRREVRVAAEARVEKLPKVVMLEHVAETGMTRPAYNKKRNQLRPSKIKV
jgi:hypothetical protein